MISIHLAFCKRSQKGFIMSYVILFSIIAVLLILETIYVFMYKKNIADICDQIEFVLENDSSKRITLQLRSNDLIRLATCGNQLLEQKEQMVQIAQRRNDEINSTITSLSHDIRTPLTSLHGYLQLAAKSENPEIVSQYLSSAKERNERLRELTEELFLYAKLQNPDYVIESEKIELINILKHSLFSFIEAFENRKEPIIQLPEHSLFITANQKGLERIFENIIRNYLYHGDDPLQIECSSDSNLIHLTFSNPLKQGADHPDTSRIFERFYIADDSRSTNTSGLGLYIVKSLVQKLGGHIEAHIHGNIFSISLHFPCEKKLTEEQRKTALHAVNHLSNR